MRYIFAGGGTAGHINPAIAVAGAVKEKDKDAKILFIGTKDGLESKLVPEAGYEIEFIDVKGFERSLSPKNIVVLFKAISSLFKAKKIIKEFGPDVVVGTGGYVSGPVVYSAAKMKIPTVIHEQNVFAGRTTGYLAKYADRVCLSFETVKPLKVKNEKAVAITGNPVRQELLGAVKENARTALDIDSRPLVLSYGGSGGALSINKAVCEMLKLSLKDGQLNHIHGTGKRDINFVTDYLKSNNILYNGEKGVTVSEYVDMTTAMPACDIVVARSGAITLSEIACLGKPAILVPSPNVTDNHQYFNALSFVKKGAAVIIPDDELTGERLYNEVLKLAFDESKLSEMSLKAKELAIPDAAEKISDIIMNLAKDKTPLG